MLLNLHREVTLDPLAKHTLRLLLLIGVSSHLPPWTVIGIMTILFALEADYMAIHLVRF